MGRSGQETGAAVPAASGPRFDVVVVGAGFGGLYMLHLLRALGLSARVVEAGDGVGGTWYWNRYPGARCDVESMQYSFSFSEELQQEWRWSERYAAQPEILRYADHVADRFDLRRDIQFDTRIVSAPVRRGGRALAACDAGRRNRVSRGSASWRPAACRRADAGRHGPRVVPGQDLPHRAMAARGVDFTGQRVAVIGTGSSGIQSIPVIAQQAAHLHVFQRTPNFSVPARNAR